MSFNKRKNLIGDTTLGRKKNRKETRHFEFKKQMKSIDFKDEEFRVQLKFI
jgi:hypothetical protein